MARRGLSGLSLAVSLYSAVATRDSSVWRQLRRDPVELFDLIESNWNWLRRLSLGPRPRLVSCQLNPFDSVPASRPVLEGTEEEDGDDDFEPIPDDRMGLGRGRNSWPSADMLAATSRKGSQWQSSAYRLLKSR